MTEPVTIDELPLFLAHAIALEEESVERYDELADAMEAHNNRSLAALFRQFAGFGRLHAAAVRQAAEGLELPTLKPWEYRWPDEEAPETAAHAGTHYLMTTTHALEAARVSEARGRDFYRWVAETSADARVRELAAEFADEEAGHVATLERWLADAPSPPADWEAAPDPPNAPD